MDIYDAGGANEFEEAIYERLKGKKKHFCPDWDYAAIDEKSPEFDACTCDFTPRLVPKTIFSY